MAEMTAEMDQMQVPDGGVASFMMSDEDIASLEREEDQQLAEEVYGGEGISQFTDMAAQMAGLGRFGDDVIVHAQTGELVIPKKILDDNPEIKEAVFQQLMAQGVEDPEQYVVGSSSASINPETGLAEYGFFKSIRRAVSKVAKGVKKVASKVVKVAKKVAPIVLPIALTLAFPALGAYGAALGSGIGTLVQGGSFKDALKSAALSGLSSAAFSGISNIGGEGGFTGGFTKSLANPGARFAQVGGQLKSGFTGQGFNFGQQFTGVPPTSTTPENKGVFQEDIARQTSPVSSAEQMQTDLSSYDPNDPAYFNKGAPTDTTQIIDQSTAAGPGRNTNLMDNKIGDYSGRDLDVQGYFDEKTLEKMQQGAANNLPPDDRSFFQKSKDFMFGKEPTSVDIAKAKSDAYRSAIKEGYSPADANYAANKIAEKTAAGPGYLRTFGPAAGLTLGATYLGGGFEPVEDEPVDVVDRDSQGNLITGATLFANNEGDYRIPGLQAAPIVYNSPKTPYQSYLDRYNPSLNNQPFLTASPTVGTPFQRVAQGGEIFPRRTGGIMPDEGIPGKDSVRAMLMPGEFVMTTDAVKGMGNGNLQKGIQDMYGVMANLERKGRMA